MSNLDHINSLISHGAMLRDQVDWSTVPLTVDFYNNAVRHCKTYSCEAIVFGLVLPGIEPDFELAIWKDGHVDSGSPASIAQVLDRQGFR